MGLQRALDHLYIGPTVPIRQAHYHRPVRLIFYPLQLPPSPQGSVSFRTKEPWGDDPKVKGVTNIFYDGMRPIRQKGGFKVIVTMS